MCARRAPFEAARLVGVSRLLRGRTEGGRRREILHVSGRLQRVAQMAAAPRTSELIYYIQLFLTGFLTIF